MSRRPSSAQGTEPEIKFEFAAGKSTTEGSGIGQDNDGRHDSGIDQSHAQRDHNRSHFALPTIWLPPREQPLSQAFHYHIRPGSRLWFGFVLLLFFKFRGNANKHF